MSRCPACLIVFACALSPVIVTAQSLPEQIVERTNMARWENGELPPLKLNLTLQSAAQLHSSNMAQRDFFMHCDPDTLTTPFDRMTNAGYNWTAAAENIAAGSATAAGTMQQWLGSPGHLANIMSTSTWELGVGYAYQNPDANNVRSGGTQQNCFQVTSFNNPGYRHYWTQKFGRRANVYPLVIAREAYAANACLIDLYVYGSGFATQMRFSNDGNTWSLWQPYSPDTLWPLQGMAGQLVTVYGEIRNAQGSVRAAQDSIVLGSACGSEPNPDLLFADGFES